MDLRRELTAALSLLQAKKGAEAEARLAALTSTASGNADVWQLYGGALKLQGRNDEAARALERSLAIDPKQPNVRNNYGNLLYLLERRAEALCELDEALRLRADYPEAHYNKALVLDALGRQHEALEAATHACRSPKAPARFHALRAKLLAGTREHAGAEAAYSEALRQAVETARRTAASEPTKPDALIKMGDSLRFLGQHDDAVSAYERALQADDVCLLAHQRLNQALWELDRKDRFLESYRRVLARKADALALRRDYAHQLFASGLAAEAEVQLSQALSHPDATWVERAERGRARAHLGRVDAFDDFVAAEGAAQSQPAYWIMRADAELRFARYDEALRSVDRGLAVDRWSQELHARRYLARRAVGVAAFAEADEANRLPGLRHLDTPPEFSNRTEFLRLLADHLRTLHTTRVHPFDQTLRNGTQTLGTLLTRPNPIIRALREQIDRAVRDYIAAMPHDDAHPVFARRRREFGYAGSWSVCLRPNGFHTNHIHPMGWISSALYIALPDDLDDAESKSGWFKIGESNMGLGARDRPDRFVKPEEGLLVLFPSYLWHGTVPFATGNRLTVAFDVVPSG